MQNITIIKVPAAVSQDKITIPTTQDWHATDIAAPAPSTSNITKISGNRVYLKDKPEALILMQTAQIERLNEYLKDYKCKYRQLSQQTLDRQSYEVQIKQLFQKDYNNKQQIQRLNKTIKTIVGSSQQYRKQISSAQEKNKKLEDDLYQAKGKQSLVEKELQNIRETYEKYRRRSDGDINTLNRDLNASKTYLDSVQKINSELLVKVNSIQNYQRRIFELETQTNFYKQQAERLSKNSAQLHQKTLQQEIQYSALSDRNQFLTQTFQNLKDEHLKNQDALLNSQKINGSLNESVKNMKSLQEHNSQLKSTISTLEQVKKRAIDFEHKNAIQASQIQRLVSIIKDQQAKNGSLEKDVEDLKRNYSVKENQLKISIESEQQKILRIIAQNKEISQKLQSSQKDSSSVQQKSQKKDQIISELQGKIKGLVQKIQKSQNKVKNSEQTILILTKQLQKSKAKQTEVQQSLSELASKHKEIVTSHEANISNTKTSIIQKTSKIYDLEQALQFQKTKGERFLIDLKNFSSQFSKTKEQKSLLQSNVNSLKSVSANLQQKINQLYQQNNYLTEQVKKRDDLIQQFNVISEELKQKILIYEQQIKVCNTANKELLSIQGRLQNQLNEAKTTIINRDQALSEQKEHSNKLKDLLSQFDSVSQTMKKQIHDLTQSKTDLQQTNQKLNQQIIDFNKMIGNKVTECEKLKQQLISNDAQMRQQFQWNLEEHTKLHNTKITKITQQKQQLKLLTDNHQNEIAVLQKAKTELQANLQQANKLKNELKAKYDENQQAISQYSLTITEYNSAKEQANKDNKLKQEEIKKLKEEREQLANMFQHKIKENQSLKRKMIDLENQLRVTFEESFQELRKNHQGKELAYKQEQERLGVEVAELQTFKATALQWKADSEKQNQQLNSIAVSLQTQRQRLQNALKQNEKLKKVFRESQISLKSKFDNELSLKQTNLRSQIDTLSKQKQSQSIQLQKLSQKTTGYEARLALMMQQIQRLHSLLNNSFKQNKSDVQSLQKVKQDQQDSLVKLQQQAQQNAKKQEQLTILTTTYQKKITIYRNLIHNIESQFFSIQMIINQLKNERDTLIKKNISLVAAIHQLSDEQLALSRKADDAAKSINKESKSLNELNKHFSNVTQFLGQVEGMTVSQEIVSEVKQITIKK